MSNTAKHHLDVHRLDAADESVAPDILRGADQIALFLFGDSGARRRIYDLAEAGVLPVFRLGRIICARRSTLRSWIDHQEAEATPGLWNGGGN